jgi:hypothetical protein
MGERSQETTTSDALEDLFDPLIGELSDDDLDDFEPVLSGKQQLAEKRRRAERRLEEKRLREELGYYDLELDDL